MGFPSAELFYGMPFYAESTSPDHDLAPWVGVHPCEMAYHPTCEVVWYGGEDEPIAAVAVKASHRSTTNWNVGRTAIELPAADRDELHVWDASICDFCRRNGIPLRPAAVGWHLAVDDR